MGRRTKTGDAARAVGYVRASKDEQALGPEAQRAALAAWTKRQRVELLTVYEDLGVSGGAELENRPGLRAALATLAASRAGVLLVAKRDRIARDPMIAAMVERFAERAGAAVVSAAGEGNGDSPADLLMRRMIDAFAEYERMIIRARTRAALAVKRARGEKTGGDVPYGYRVEPAGVRLVEVPQEQRAIRAARKLAAAGVPLRAIAVGLAAKGFSPRRGPWHPEKIASILRRAS